MRNFSKTALPQPALFEDGGVRTHRVCSLHCSTYSLVVEPTNHPQGRECKCRKGGRKRFTQDTERALMPKQHAYGEVGSSQRWLAIERTNWGRGAGCTVRFCECALFAFANVRNLQMRIPITRACRNPCTTPRPRARIGCRSGQGQFERRAHAVEGGGYLYRGVRSLVSIRRRQYHYARQTHV